MLLMACTTATPLSKSELYGKRDGYWRDLQLQSQQVSAELSLEQAVARALRHNMEYRLKLLEVAIASGNRKLATYQLLPSLTAQAGYRVRDKELASSSQNVFSGNTSLLASTSSEKQSSTDSLELGWSMLDFGMRFYRAREYGEQALIAEEERRGMMQQIVRDLVYAWSLAQAADRMTPQIEDVRQMLAEALREAATIASDRLRDPVDALEYRKNLLLLAKRLNQLIEDMDKARGDLAHMLDLPAGSDFTLAKETPGNGQWDSVAMPSASLAAWQMLALVNRPELRQAQYQSRLAEIQSKKMWLELMPALGLTAGAYHDDNRFLVHKHWNENSARLSFDLMKLASMPQTLRMKRLSKSVAHDRERMQATVVLSQMAISMQATALATQNRCLSRQLREVDDRRVDLMSLRMQARMLDRLSLLRAKVDNLLLHAEAAIDEASWRRSQLAVLVSAGIDVVPRQLRGRDDAAVAEEIQHWWQAGMQQSLQQQLQDARSRLEEPAVQVVVSPESQAEETGKTLCM